MAKQQKQNKLTEEENRKRVALTDFLKEEYEKRGVIPNFPMMMSQVQKYQKDYNYTFSSVKYTLWYMIYVQELELFDYEKGSILNLVPYYHEQAKQYYLESTQIKRDFKDFKQVKKKQTVTYNPKVVRKKLNITFD